MPLCSPSGAGRIATPPPQACHKHVALPSVRYASFNVAVAGSIVLYDRFSKQQRKEAEAAGSGSGSGAGDSEGQGAPVAVTEEETASAAAAALDLELS